MNDQSEAADKALQRQERLRAVRRRLREAVTSMQSSDQISRVLAALTEGLDELGIPFEDCGINLVDPNRDPPVISINSMGREGDWKEPEEIWGHEQVFLFWQVGVPAYRRDLQTEDTYAEKDGIRAALGHPVRCVLDVPFASGTLAINSDRPDAFAPDDIAALEQLSVVLEEGFRRREDLQNLEERNRQLEAEVARRRQAEETLRESEERYRALVENAPVCIHEVDLQGRLVSMNRAGLDMMAAADESAICGLNYLSVVVEADRRRVETLLERAYRGEAVFFQFTAQGEDGLRSFDSSFIPIKDGNGRVVKLMGVTQDITERLRMEEGLRRTQNLESLGVLAGGIAHDFNNVLTGVIGGLELLQMVLEEGHQGQGIVHNTLQAAERTRHLTQQLLTFAKGGAPVKQNMSIEALIEETAQLSLRGSKSKASYDLAPGLCAVEVDKGQIGQVIQNLVINADQAMPEGGIVRLEAVNAEVTDRDTLPLEAGTYVKVSVIDTGVGIPAEALARIFDPYFSTKKAGHGLGLSIVHSIVQRHGGHTAVRSEAGKGTRFDFYLPAASRSAAAPAAARLDMPTGTGRILLMDDEKVIHQTVGAMLEKLGYEVEKAYEGAAALEAHAVAERAARPFDLLIFDLTVPGGMGGQETLERLRLAGASTPVLVASGYAHDPIMTDFEAYGFAGRVTKPINMRELAEVVHKALRSV